MLATNKDVQRLHASTVQFKAVNGHLTDVIVRETMGVFEVGAVFNGQFYKSNLFKQVCFSLEELGLLMDKVKRHKSFFVKPKKSTKIRTF